MSYFSDTIKKLRKENNITQAELGKELSISPQAISKWEKGMSEPDTETLRAISNYFNVSIDELLGGIVQQKDEEIGKEQKQDNPKIIIGYCDKCKKPIEQNSKYHVKHSANKIHKQYILCDDCEKIENYQRQQRKIQEERASLKKGLICGGIVGIVILLILIVLPKSEFYKGILFGVIFGYVGFAFVSQMFWGDWIIDILSFFCKSFHMPGVIFELSLDGIISLICIKLFLGLLSGMLSAMIFLFGVVIACITSIVTFPFALPRLIKKIKNENIILSSMEVKR